MHLLSAMSYERTPAGLLAMVVHGKSKDVPAMGYMRTAAGLSAMVAIGESATSNQRTF